MRIGDEEYGGRWRAPARARRQSRGSGPEAVCNIRVAILALAVLLAAAPARAQLSQTLPRGHDGFSASSLTSFPVNTSNDQIWQWHYDSSEFDADESIMITEISLRASSAAFGVSAFSFAEFEVVLIEASTDYTLAGHQPVFASNVLREQIVRSGPWSGGAVPPVGGSAAPWIPIGLTGRFRYDPSTGNDFIIQVRKCGATTPWQTTMDAETGLPGAVGGNRYGHTSDCNATFHNSAGTGSNELVPVVKIDYVPSSQTLPRGFADVDGSSSSSFPINTTNDQRWQWHYDSSEFDAQQPIEITEVSLRASLAAQGVAAFAFPDFEVFLIEASTDYGVGAHDPDFDDNVLRAKLVAQSFSGGPVPPSAGSVATWIPIGLTESFIYDPSTGNDLIIEVRKCGAATIWGGGMDMAGGALGTLGGNRYGHTTDCAAATQNFQNGDAVPVVRIDFRLPGECTGPPVVDYPWFEDFDGLTAGPTTPPPGWLNDPADNAGGDDSDWLFFSGPTPSSGTGPGGDATTGTGIYAYVEDSNGEHAAVNLLTPCFDLSSVESPMLHFSVFSVNSEGAGGAHENSLSVDVLSDVGGLVQADILPPIGHIAPVYAFFSVDLGPFADQVVRFRFRGSNDGGSFTHDIAIDDVYVGEGGTREGFIMQSRINAGAHVRTPVKTATGGDGVGISVFSTPTFWYRPLVLLGHLFNDGPFPGSDLLPDLYMPVSSLILVFDGTFTTPFGQFGLPPAGLHTGFTVPVLPALAPTTLVVQGVLLDTAAANSIYATTMPHYIDFE